MSNVLIFLGKSYLYFNKLGLLKIIIIFLLLYVIGFPLSIVKMLKSGRLLYIFKTSSKMLTCFKSEKSVFLKSVWQTSFLYLSTFLYFYKVSNSPMNEDRWKKRQNQAPSICRLPKMILELLVGPNMVFSQNCV